MLAEVFVLLLTILVAVYIYKWVRLSQGLPPGPPRYPLIGSLPSLIKMSKKLGGVHKALTTMARTYGDVFTFYLPGIPIITINSLQLAKQALVSQKDDFSGRPVLFTLKFLTQGGKGAFSGFSAKLVVLRKIFHSAMRMYQPRLEGTIFAEAEAIARRFQSYGDEPFDPRPDISLATTNVIYAIMYGKRFDLDDPEFLTSIKFGKEVSKYLGPMNVLNFFPWLINFPIPQTKVLYKILENRARFKDARYFHEKESFQPNKIRHLVDALLQAKLDEEQDGGLIFDDTDLLVSTANLFGAGSETTATSLKWLIAYMLNFPKIQEKLHAEVNETFGYDGKVQFSERKRCPYLEATLTEVLRCATVAPLIVHKATRDTTLSGYKIPKDTTLILNIWAINHDDREWENHEEFNPNRFLDSEGNFTGTSNMSYLPFGAGRRVCIGESLAKIELFVIATTLLQKFKFESPPGCPLPNLKEGTRGLVYAPNPYTVIAKER